MYPEVVESTPGILSKSASVHQKQPPAKVATLVEEAGPGGPARLAAMG
jgi:hypothetical protein